MPKFSARSMGRLLTCEEPLVKLFERVVEVYDCTVLWGRRGKVDQDEAFSRGMSHARWPDSKHNCAVPDMGAPKSKWAEDPDGLSRAVDVAPWPIDWRDEERFYHFGGYVLGVAEGLGLRGILRWGGDWDGDLDLRDQGFNDLAHWELRS